MDIEAIAAFGQDSGVYAFMNTAYGWPAMEAAHFLGLALLLGTVGLFDLRMLGFARVIPMRTLHRLIPFGAAAFAINLITGLMFFVSAPDQYAFNPAFQLKLGVIAIAGLNMAIFYVAFAGPLRTVAHDGPVALLARIAAALSLTSWIAVIGLGRVITYFRPPYHWCAWC